MKPVPRWFVAVCWIMAINFSLWTGLQANDPHPVQWMLIYGAAAICSAVLPGRLVGAAVAALIGGIALIWGIYLGHEVWGVVSFGDLFTKMGDKYGALEVGREAGGLIIVAIWLVGSSAFRFARS